VYEYLLSKIATAGVNGQFRTPRHIIRMMVDLMEPKADEIVCDAKLPITIQDSTSVAWQKAA
jgi:type I restriction-modification system DNA methylase subunit